jgi:hypothetical protein
MSFLWLFFGKDAMLKEAARDMREGLLNMKELKSSRWTPMQKNDLENTLVEHVIHSFTLCYTFYLLVTQDHHCV